MSKADLAELTGTLLDVARRAGADGADALAVAGTSVSIDIRQGALEQAERSEGVEVGLRVFVGQRQACVSASDISHATLQALAERAVAMAKEAPTDKSCGLADPEQLAKTWDLAGLDLEDFSPEPSAAQLEEEAKVLEAAALSRPGVQQAESSAGYSRRALHIAQSNGFSGGYGRTGHSRYVTAFCGTGTAMERDIAGEARLHGADLPDLEAIGFLAADRALARLDAVKPPTGRYNVVYDERIAVSLIGHVLNAINGESIARGSSWARDLMGQQIFPTGVSLIEDPLRYRGPSSRPFDAEGLAVQRKALIEDGRLASWVLDLATARRLGLQSTANAMRGTVAPPSPGTTNIDLTPGAYSRQELLDQMGTGLLVTSLIGSTISATTGDYSRGASGFWVENGQIQYPVHECTIAGNLKQMLGNMVVGNDARPHLAMRVPSILVEGMTLAGA